MRIAIVLHEHPDALLQLGGLATEGGFRAAKVRKVTPVSIFEIKL